MDASLSMMTFHIFNDRSANHPFPRRVFLRRTASLHENDYQTLCLLDSMDCRRPGEPHPRRFCATTFSGYRTVCVHGFPRVQRHDISSPAFLAVGEEGTAKPAGRSVSVALRTRRGQRGIQPGPG